MGFFGKTLLDTASKLIPNVVRFDDGSGGSVPGYVADSWPFLLIGGVSVGALVTVGFGVCFGYCICRQCSRSTHDRYEDPSITENQDLVVEIGNEGYQQIIHE